MKDKVRLSKEKGVENWKCIKEQLENEMDSEQVWDKAIQFFDDRLTSRYLEPVKNIKEAGSKSGEGFAIMVILCSLIEFLESLREGKMYKYLKKGEKLGKHQYCSSKIIFIDFLMKREPFKGVFKKKSLAEDFYSNVRCGLVHEAKTNGNWIINEESNSIYKFEGSCNIIYRNNFQQAIVDYINSYKEELKTSLELKNAFIIKFDNIADIK